MKFIKKFIILHLEEVMELLVIREGKNNIILNKINYFRIFPRRTYSGVFSVFKEANVNRAFESHTRMYLDEFQFLVDELNYLKKHPKLSKVATKICFEDKILLTIIWIVKYVDYAVLSHMFSISPPVISKLLKTIFPLLVEYFIKFIPNDIISETTSKLSSKIVAVIDSTIHATKKPAKNQHLAYNEHYRRHGIMTTLLVDYDNYISCFVTAGAGRMHDATAARHMKCFVRVLNNRFALGDPGYEGVPYVVSGLKTNQLNSPERISFDAISRNEQVRVEHVNNFIKSCKVLSKRNQFYHSKEMHIACVFIVCGWYNWMKFNFNKFS